jgi:hypothetical protein
MRFFRPRGSEHPAILWDSKTGSPVYEFQRGIFETKDPAIIGLMLNMGFPSEPPSEQVQIALDISRDNSRPPPPPPPLFKDVPATEEEAKRRGK